MQSIAIRYIRIFETRQRSEAQEMSVGDFHSEFLSVCHTEFKKREESKIERNIRRLM